MKAGEAKERLEVAVTGTMAAQNATLNFAPKERYGVPRKDEPVPQPASSSPERYLLSKASTTGESPAAPDQSPLVADQPKVQILTSIVHRAGQKLNFEASLKQTRRARSPRAGK